MAPCIVPAGRDRVDELRPLRLQLHHHHARVSRVQRFVDDDTSWTMRRRSCGEVWTLVVDEAARGAGVGSALLDAVDAELAARGITGLVIGVMEGNDDARRLYERRALVPEWRQLYRVAL